MSWSRYLRKDRTAKPAMADTGFTLLEMLIALAIFSLAALTLLRLTAFGIDQTARLETRTYEEIVAQNLAAIWLTDPVPPSLGDASGTQDNAGRSYRWTRTVEAQGDGALLTITISVSAQQAAGSPTILTFVRPAEIS